MTGWIGLISFAVLAVGAARAARCNLREWRTLRGHPLIRGDGSAIREGDWKVYGARGFPDPGSPSRWLLDERQCRSYAHLAAKRNRWHDGLVLVGNIVVAALLGLVLVQVDTGKIAAVIEANRVLVGLGDEIGFDVKLFSWGHAYTDSRLRWTLLTAVAAGVLMASVGMKSTYADLSEAYTRAADRQRDEEWRARTLAAQAPSGPPTPTAATPLATTSIWRHLLGRAQGTPRGHR